MWRRSSRRWMVIPSAPPKSARTAAATGSGSMVRRAWRTVATWSMLTPSRIMVAPSRRVERRRQVRADLPIAARLAAQDLVEEESQHQRHDFVEDCGQDGNAR